MGGIFQINRFLLIRIVHLVLPENLESARHSTLQSFAIRVPRERHISIDNHIINSLNYQDMALTNYFHLLCAYGIFAVIVLVTWHLVRKPTSNPQFRMEMGKQFFSMTTWIIIADVALLYFVPDCMDWIMTIGLLGIAALCYFVGVKILDTPTGDDAKKSAVGSKNSILVYVQECDNHYCAEVDNLPGSIVFTADSYDGILEEAPRVVRLHVEGLQKNGEVVPDWLANEDYDFEFIYERPLTPMDIKMLQ